MKSRNWRRERSAQLLKLGVASTDTLGLPVGDIIEPMGFWRKEGISHE